MTGPPSTMKDHIECAIARGEPLETICVTLNVAPRVVRQVRAAMDAAVAEDSPAVMGHSVSTDDFARSASDGVSLLHTTGGAA